MNTRLFSVPDTAPATTEIDVKPLPAERFTRSFRLPYHLGLYVAVNGIRDVFAIIDGPDCLYRKAEWVHGKHDLNSTLLDVMGEHRIVSTLLYSAHVIKSDGGEVRERIRRVGRIRRAGALLICSMPHVMIIGTQYDRIMSELAEEVPIPMVEVPSRSLSGDWLDGYDETLLAIARNLDLPDIDPDPNRVAIVGYLMDRTEADNIANTVELRRMLEAIGLEVTSVWLENQRYAELADVQRAGHIIALPHAKRAAHALAGRTGAKVVDCEVPFGLRGTRAFLRGVGKATGRLERVEEFIEAEQARLVPRLEWVVPHYFAGRRAVFVGDPYMFRGVVSICEELGIGVPLLVGSARKPEDFELPPQSIEPTLVSFAPPHGTLDRVIRQVLEAHPVDLFIGTSTAQLSLSVHGPQPRRIEFGFPCFGRHAVADSPYLGFNGWAGFVNMMLDALTAQGSEASAS